MALGVIVILPATGCVPVFVDIDLETHNIDVQYYDCNDSEYVSRIFDWENNRGKTVEPLDIIKNPILVKIPDDKKFEIYEKWEKLKHKNNDIYKKNFGQKIFDLFLDLFYMCLSYLSREIMLPLPCLDHQDSDGKLV